MSKEKLSAKITSPTELANALGVGAVVSPRINGYGIGPRMYGVKLPWWAAREQARLKQGVYRRTAVTDAINQYFPWLCSHVSVEDQQQVAYTASNEDGERDKQLRLSPGRFVKRILPQLTDAEVQELEQMHRAELDDTFLIARSEAEIREVYTKMVGDSGCMRGEPSRFGLERHPSVVYTGPGFGVAHLRLPDGKIYARCVIWENPDNPADKRAVRAYGSPLLRTKLLNSGYVFKTLRGAKLARVPINLDKRLFYMPYLDGPEGNQSDRTASHVIDDGEHLVLISADEAAKRTDAVYVRGAGGYVTIPAPMKDVEFTSVFTGRSFRSVRDGMLTAYHAGTFGHVPYVESRDPTSLVGVRIHEDGTTSQVHARMENVTQGYLLDPATIEATQLKQLDRGLYPAATIRWALAAITDDQGRNILKEDAIAYLHADGSTTYKFKPLAPAKLAGYVKATSTVDKPPAYIHKDRPTFKVFGARTYFDTVYHQGKYCQNIATDAWESRRNFRIVDVFNTQLALPHGTNRMQFMTTVPDAKLVALAANVRHGPVTIRQDFICHAMRTLCLNGVVMSVEGHLQIDWNPRFRNLQTAYAQPINPNFSDMAAQRRLFQLFCEGANVSTTV